MLSENRVDRWTGIAVVLVLILGCVLVLRPFLSAILWSVILVFSTWPIYRRIESAVAGRKGLAGAVMVFAVTAVLIVPLALIGTSLEEDVTSLVEKSRQLLSEGPSSPPGWVAQLPVVGVWAHDRWQEMAGSGAKLTAALLKVLTPLRDWALRGAANLGESLLYLTLSVFMAFFLYRDGAALAAKLKTLFARVGGPRASTLLRVAGDTIKGVVYGFIGTALVQGLLVGLGLWIAGIPRVLLLGVLACVLSLIPVGPALVWVPAALWLFQKGAMGWAVFLVVWGLLVVGLIDNFLKPYFIGKESRLPFMLVFLGSLGGVMAFGFLGIFLGPTLLAIAYAAFLEWSSRDNAPVIPEANE